MWLPNVGSPLKYVYCRFTPLHTCPLLSHLLPLITNPYHYLFRWFCSMPVFVNSMESLLTVDSASLPSPATNLAVKSLRSALASSLLLLRSTKLNSPSWTRLRLTAKTHPLFMLPSSLLSPATSSGTLRRYVLSFVCLFWPMNPCCTLGEAFSFQLTAMTFDFQFLTLKYSFYVLRSLLIRMVWLSKSTTLLWSLPQSRPILRLSWPRMPLLRLLLLLPRKLSS